MGDRQVTSPGRAFAQMNEEIAANLRRVQKRILSPGSTGDTFTPGAQTLAVQALANPAAPFTTIAQLDVLPGAWILYGTTSINNGPLGYVASGNVEVLCRIRVDGVTLVQLDHVDPWWFPAVGGSFVGRSFAPITRATFASSASVTLEARVSSDAGGTPGDSLAERTRLVVSPY